MKLALLCFGKLKTPGLRLAADHYAKLLGGFTSIQEVELKPLTVPDKSPASRLAIQKKEGLLLLERLDGLGARSELVLLDETGKAAPTQQWADRARGWERESAPIVALALGSSLGFSPEVRARAKGSLSLGPQTLSYELSRVVLLEQLYRAWSVVRGHPYHNEGQ